MVGGLTGHPEAQGGVAKMGSSAGAFVPGMGSVPGTNVPHVSGNENEAPDRLREVAQEFESLFVKQMLDAMLDTVDRENSLLHGGFAEEIFEDMLFTEYSQMMAQTGTFGLADMIYDQLQEYESPGSISGVDSGAEEGPDASAGLNGSSSDGGRLGGASEGRLPRQPTGFGRIQELLQGGARADGGPPALQTQRAAGAYDLQTPRP